MTMIKGLVDGTEGSTTPVVTDASGKLMVNLTSSASRPIYNDTQTPLAGSATFSGTARDLGNPSRYKTFEATFFSDQTSAVGGAQVELSFNGTTWFPAAATTLTGGTPVTLQVPVTARYYRVRFINEAVTQTQFIITSGYTVV